MGQNAHYGLAWGLSAGQPAAPTTAATLMAPAAGRFAAVVVEKKEVASYLMKTFAEFEDDNPGNLKGIKAGGKIIPIRSPTG